MRFFIQTRYASPEVVTPLMFEYGLLERARRARKHIVLPEGYDDRILRAAATLLARDVADLTILGEEIEIRSRAIGLGLDISRATVLSNHDHVLVYRFADEYHRTTFSPSRTFVPWISTSFVTVRRKWITGVAHRTLSSTAVGATRSKSAIHFARSAG